MKKIIRNLTILVSMTFVMFSSSNDVFAQTQRNPVLEECTGTWCQWCPCGHDIMESIVATMPNAIMIAYHGPANGSDPFSFFSGNTILSSMGFSAYPTGAIDRVSGIQSRGAWTGLMNSRNTVPATVAIDVERSFNQTTREFVAIIDFTALSNLDGQYNFNVILLEDGIVWSQTGNSSCPGDPNYVHNHLVRDMMNGALGEEIINGTWNQNEVITKNVIRTIPVPTGSAPDMVWDSCHVVVLAYEVGSPLTSNAEIQQAVQLDLISPDYLVEVTSTSGDLIIDRTGEADFTTVIRNEGLHDDTYYVDVEMDAPSGWTADFTTPNGTYPAGQRDSVDVSAGDSLVVDVSVTPNVLNGFGEITVQFTSKNEPNISATATLRVVTTTGVPGLIVDATEEGFGDLLIDAFDQAFEYPFGIVSSEALSSSVDYTDFSLIAWSTGNVYPVFTQNEVDGLTDLLDSGGRLLINGQNIGEDIFGPGGQSQFAQSFYNNYLHADYIDPIGLTLFLKGIDDDPISDQIYFTMDDIYPRSPDQFEPYDASAASLFTFGTFAQYNSLRADDGTNRVVYLGFGLEQVSDAAVMDTIATRSITWLMEDVVLNTPKEELAVISFNLEQNYPNPFNPSTTISYSIPQESQVSLVVYDIMGRQIAELVNSKQSAGEYNVNLDASSMASGTYFYKLTAGEFISVKKMVLLK